jgi:hypothetical protein
MSRPTSRIENEWPNSRPIIDKIYVYVSGSGRAQVSAGDAVESFNLAN